MWVCCFRNYRLPTQAAISPIFCMVFRMFFFIVIMVISKVRVKNIFWLAADTGQHLAVVSHVLNQILDNNILHNKNTSKIEYEKFWFFFPGAVNHSTRHGGIIAPVLRMRKVWNWLLIGKFWLLYPVFYWILYKLRIIYEHFISRTIWRDSSGPRPSIFK